MATYTKTLAYELQEAARCAHQGMCLFGTRMLQNAFMAKCVRGVRTLKLTSFVNDF